MMKRHAFTIAMTLIYLGISAQEPSRYAYMGKDTLIDSTLFLRKGTTITIDKPIEEEDSIRLYIDSTNPIIFKANLKNIFELCDSLKAKSIEETDQEEASEQTWKQWLKGNWPWLVLLLAILVLSAVTIIRFIMRKRKNSVLKQPSEIMVKPEEDSFIKSDDGGDLDFLFDNSKNKNKAKHFLQKIILPEDKNEAMDCIAQIANYHDNRKDVADKLK